MKPILILTTLIFLICLFSWGRNDNINAQNTIDLKLIKVISDSITFYEYSYNNTNLISEEKSKLRYTKYNYNDTDQLISVDCYEDPALYSSSSVVIEASRKREEWTNPNNTEKSYSIIYEYDAAGQLIKSTNYLGYSIYSYDKNNRISSLTFYHDDKISNYIDFEYDKKGNLTKRNKFQVSESGEKALINKALFKFDSKHNPYKAFNNLMIPGKYTNQNNIVMTTSTNYHLIEGMEDKKNTIKTSFQYNVYGYPITKDINIKYMYE